MKQQKSTSTDLFSQMDGDEAHAEAEPLPEPAIPLPAVDPSWLPFFRREYAKPYMAALREFVGKERKSHTVYPPAADVFQAFQLTGLDRLKVLILGQDPYHGAGQAHGLSFSVKPGVKPPPSLVNIFKELKDDLGLPIPGQGYLKPWAEQGVMMLNAVLTVRAATPNSHKDRGWEQFTDAAIEEVNRKADPVVFVLWGAYARKKAKLIDGGRHLIIESSHPSPFSADNGFFGSKPFSKIRHWLETHGRKPVEWQL